MAPQFDYNPAHAVMPFVRAHGDGVIFSSVLPKEVETGLQLIHIPDGETVYIPFSDEYRVGKVFSVFIKPFNAEEWLYRYRCGDHYIVDAHAFSVTVAEVREGGIEKKVTACSCYPLRGTGLFPGTPERPLPPADWSEQVIYGIHVRGFTAAMPGDSGGRGTFSGVVSRIPYLTNLGITAVELMPVYMPLPRQRSNRAFRTMQEALGAWPVGPQGDPLRDLKERPNYWGFGRGLYYAIRPEFGTQKDFALMVRALHEAGIRVLLQIYFDKGVSPAGQLAVLRFYIDRFGVDGFRLLGNASITDSLVSAPSLADTALFFDSFPFRELQEEEEAGSSLFEEDIDRLFDRDVSGGADSSAEDAALERTRLYREGLGNRAKRPVAHGQASFPNLITSGEDFQTLIRRFVKSDDYVMKDFLKLFLGVPAGHGVLRYITGHEGFTLSDLVSYNERHNEANGEFGLDGRAENYSWNCGEEGPTEDPGVLALRRKQVRNFLTLLMLSQGTPMLRQGDERCNSQNGNNNPYCQDNEISWIDWEDTPERRSLTALTAKLIAFRQEHPIFRCRRPFQYIDYLGVGHPDVSLHGSEAWKPDLGEYSHSIGIAFCENYACEDLPGGPVKKNGKKQPELVYAALNMYWKDLSLALPKLPPHYVWKVFFDTEAEEGFLDRPVIPEDQHSVSVASRSIRLLRAVPDADSLAREMKKERLRKMPSARQTVRDLRRTAASGDAKKKVIDHKIPRRIQRLMKPLARPGKYK